MSEQYDYPYEKPGANDEDAREKDVQAPEHTLPGPTYVNPNENQEYVPPEVELVVDADGTDDEPADVPNDVPDGGEEA